MCFGLRTVIVKARSKIERCVGKVKIMILFIYQLKLGYSHVQTKCYRPEYTLISATGLQVSIYKKKEKEKKVTQRTIKIHQSKQLHDLIETRKRDKQYSIEQYAEKYSRITKDTTKTQCMSLVEQQVLPAGHMNSPQVFFQKSFHSR